MPTENADVSDLVCLACFSGPGITSRVEVGGDGKTRIVEVRVAAMALVIDGSTSLARCRWCGSSFEAGALRRWNEVDLRLKMKGTAFRPKAITSRPPR